MNTIKDLLIAIQRLGLNPHKLIGYEMDDYFRECPYFIREYEGKWQVFYWGEKGNMNNFHEFSTQNGAIEYVFAEIVQKNANDSFWHQCFI